MSRSVKNPASYLLDFWSIGMKYSITGAPCFLGGEIGFNPRPIREGWPETVRHEMKLLGMS